MLKVSTNKIVNLHKKSRCPLCLSQALTLGGLTPIPLVSKEGKIVPGLAWKDFVLPEDPLEAVGKVKELFSQNGVVGVALKCGVFSRLIVLDIDCPEKFESFYPLQKLIDQAPYVIETKDPGHYHIGFAYDPDLSENRNLLNEAGFELKSNGSLVNFFTVLSEAQYKPLKLEPLRPMPQELKEKLLSLLHKTKSPTPKETPELQKTNIDPQEVIELASEVYLKGQRQYWVIFVAGYLRKLGFSLEEVKEALEDFLKAQNDEELSMRLAGIEHTYKEPIENVKGLFGLLELGLSDKAYLKLQNLKGEREGEHTKYLTIKEIMNLQVKEPSWLIPGFLPEGLSLFAGRPKIGKSWLALQIALTCMQIGKKVVYYALEDTPGRLQKRLKVLGIENPEDLPNLIVFSFELARIGRGAVKEF
jgi:DNA-binding transcriptional MerR regulator